MAATKYFTFVSPQEPDRSSNYSVMRARFSSYTNIADHEFSTLPGKKQERSADLQEAIHKNKGHTLESIDEPLSYVEKAQATKLIADFLSDKGIQVNVTIIGPNVPGDVIKECYLLFDAILKKELATRQISYFELLANTHNPLSAANSAIIQEGLLRAKNSLNAAEKTLQNWLNSKKVFKTLLITKAIGDGDCLYHSTAANILYTVLDGNQNEQHIQPLKERLLPIIASQALRQGIHIPRHGSLKEAFVFLIDSYSLYSNVSEHSSLLDKIGRCNFAALSTQIFAPALRQLVFDVSKDSGTAKSIKSVLVRVMHQDFIAFGLHRQQHPNVPSTELYRSFQGSELDDIAKGKRETLLQYWLPFLPEPKDMDNADARDQAYGNFVQSAQWNDFYDAYIHIHQSSKINAGSVQQAALSIALGIDFQVIDQHTGEASASLQPYIQAGEFTVPAHSTLIYIRKGAGHFEAYIGKYNQPPSEIAVALSQQFSTTHSGDDIPFRNQKPNTQASASFLNLSPLSSAGSSHSVGSPTLQPASPSQSASQPKPRLSPRIEEGGPIPTPAWSSTPVPNSTLNPIGLSASPDHLSATVSSNFHVSPVSSLRASPSLSALPGSDPRPALPARTLAATPARPPLPPTVNAPSVGAHVSPVLAPADDIFSPQQDRFNSPLTIENSVVTAQALNSVFKELSRLEGCDYTYKEMSQEQGSRLIGVLASIDSEENEEYSYTAELSAGVEGGAEVAIYGSRAATDGLTVVLEGFAAAAGYTCPVVSIGGREAKDRGAAYSLLEKIIQEKKVIPILENRSVLESFQFIALQEKKPVGEKDSLSQTYANLILSNPNLVSELRADLEKWKEKEGTQSHGAVTAKGSWEEYFLKLISPPQYLRPNSATLPSFWSVPASASRNGIHPGRDISIFAAGAGRKEKEKGKTNERALTPT